MPSYRLLFFILTQVTGIGLVDLPLPSADANEKIDAAASPDTTDWQDLIASDSLEGWVGDRDSWTVRDGVLIGKADGTLKFNRFLLADIEPVANFELTVDVWVSAQGNSGIQYRSERREDLGPFVVTGYQCDVVAKNPDYNGMLYEERGRRILCHTGERVIVDDSGQPYVVGSSERRVFPPEQWHTYRVLVRANHHQHWIDGHPTADVIDLDATGRALSGVVGVQVHVGPPMEIHYRNFRIRRLPDDLPLISPSEAPIGRDAIKVRPQGGPKNAGKRDANAKLEVVDSSILPSAHRAGPVWLSGQPTEAQLRALADEGVATVISLRGGNEIDWDEKSLVESLGMTFVSVPIRGPNDLSPKRISGLRSRLSQATNDQPVLLHCATADRVGAVWLAHRVKDGRMALPQAIDEAARVGLRSTALKKAVLNGLAPKR